MQQLICAQNATLLNMEPRPGRQLSFKSDLLVVSGLEGRICSEQPTLVTIPLSIYPDQRKTIMAHHGAIMNATTSSQHETSANNDTIDNLIRSQHYCSEVTVTPVMVNISISIHQISTPTNINQHQPVSVSINVKKKTKSNSNQSQRRFRLSTH